MNLSWCKFLIVQLLGEECFVKTRNQNLDVLYALFQFIYLSLFIEINFVRIFGGTYDNFYKSLLFIFIRSSI
jgi:hypothetical protein